MEGHLTGIYIISFTTVHDLQSLISIYHWLGQRIRLFIVVASVPLIPAAVVISYLTFSYSN